MMKLSCLDAFSILLNLSSRFSMLERVSRLACSMFFGHFIQVIDSLLTRDRFRLVQNLTDELCLGPRI